MKTSKRLPRANEKKKHIGIALRPAQVAEVDRYLGATGISRSWLVEQLLNDWLEKRKGEK